MLRPASASVGSDADRLLPSVEAAVTQAFGHLRGSVPRNLAVVAVAFLRLLSRARFGHGRLSFGALCRVLPTVGTARAREKRLRRFLENPRLDPRGVTSGLARVVVGERGTGWWPIVLDQTHSGAAQALLAFCLAYALAVVVGSGPAAVAARQNLEIPRRSPRHGTCRTLSVLSLTMQMLAHPRWCRSARAQLLRLAARLARGQPAFSTPPPDLLDRLARA